MAYGGIFRDNAGMSIEQHRNTMDDAAIRHAAAMAGVVVSLALAGCGGTDLNAVANRLREENLDQKRQITDLQEKLKGREATVRDLQAHFAMNSPPLPTLPPERLAELFTVAKLEIRGQTDTADLGAGIKGFRVFLRTYAEDGQIVPAAGVLVIEAFELPAAPAEPKRIGLWTFTPAQMKTSWYTGLGLNHFAFSCPWQTEPAGSAITFRVRLRDALTGETLEAQLDKKITPMAAGQ